MAKENFLFFCGDFNLNWTRADLLFFFFLFFFFKLYFSQNLGISECQGGSARSVAPADWLDFSSTQEWPLQGLITSLRGGHTGCTISPTSISSSSRSTTLSSRRRRATSRSVTASVRKGARSFHKNLSGEGVILGGHWLSKAKDSKAKLNYKYFFFSSDKTCIVLWLVLRCIHQRQEAGPCVLQRSHDNTWPVLTELWNISAPKQVCYSLYTACLCVCTLLRHTQHILCFPPISLIITPALLWMQPSVFITAVSLKKEKRTKRKVKQAPSGWLLTLTL